MLGKLRPRQIPDVLLSVVFKVLQHNKVEYMYTRFSGVHCNGINKNMGEKKALPSTKRKKQGSECNIYIKITIPSAAPPGSVVSASPIPHARVFSRR